MKAFFAILATFSDVSSQPHDNAFKREQETNGKGSRRRPMATRPPPPNPIGRIEK